jgi:hypothetical protein
LQGDYPVSVEGPSVDAGGATVRDGLAELERRKLRAHRAQHSRRDSRVALHIPGTVRLVGYAMTMEIYRLIYRFQRRKLKTWE